MSFASSSSSPLVPIDPKIPTVDANSAGYIQIPTLDYTATGSGVAIDAFTPITLPYGVYILTGVLKFQGDGSNITTATAQCFVDGVNQGKVEINNDDANVDMTLTFVVASGSGGAEADLSLSVSGVTADGLSNWNLVEGINSVLKIVRVA
jgi:hypothetical protein